MTIKNLKAFLFCLSLIFCVQYQLQAQDFEGVIYYEIPEMKNQGMGEMPYMIKDSRARIEFGEGKEKGAMLFLSDESKVVFLMDAMKGYMTIDLDETAEMNESVETSEITKTGETKTIAGKNCEVWRITSEEDEVEACMAQGLGKFMMPRSPMAQKNTPEWVKEVMEEGTMPLEVVEIGDNENNLQMRATRIEEKSLESSLFEIPKGYKDMSSMMKQMMNQN
jgi:hypothetical protein